MKFILAYAICSAINGVCATPKIHNVEFYNWTDCTKSGAEISIAFINKFQNQFNKEKLYVTYFCNEHKGNNA
jgi:hypothetical protein|tara:strand:- start:454 stop:669 length:216 start_codon:yes stop_codon:yes gene_type:complete